MSEINLRANRLANVFEGMAAARRGKTRDVLDVAVVEVDGPIGTVRHVITTDTLDEAAKLLRERGEGITLDVEQRRRLDSAIAALPYGAMVSMRTRVESVDDVIVYLSAFAAVLTDVSARAQQTERELFELQSQRSAMRAFLGTDGES